jgi:hypothetical protein
VLYKCFHLEYFLKQSFLLLSSLSLYKICLVACVFLKMHFQIEFTSKMVALLISTLHYKFE